MWDWISRFGRGEIWAEDFRYDENVEKSLGKINEDRSLTPDTLVEATGVSWRLC